MCRIFSTLDTTQTKRKENETDIMKKHQNTLENIVPDENHIFDNVDPLVSNRTSKTHKNHDENITKSSKNAITKRHHKMMSTKSQNVSQNGHEMGTNCHQHHQKMTSSHHVKKRRLRVHRRFTGGSPEPLKIARKTRGRCSPNNKGEPTRKSTPFGDPRKSACS